VGLARTPNNGKDSGPRAEGSVIIPMSSVLPESVRWLWHDRIPFGKLTILEGDPGVMKSWLALAIVTAYVNGVPLPGETESHAPGRTILLTAEDGLADTIRPRLDGLGADVSRVEAFRGMRNDDTGAERPPSLAEDLWALDEALKGGLYGLVIVDPLNAYLPGDLDAHRDVAVRSVLAPLAQLAERYDVAIMTIRHLTKGARDKAIYRGGGSIAYTAAARTVLLVGIDPEDDRKQRRVVVPIKNNLAPLATGLAFELREGRFCWVGESTVTAEALLAPDPVGDEQDDRDDAVAAMHQLLEDNGGHVGAEDGTRQLHRLGLSDKAIRRARKALGVDAIKEGFGKAGRWVWRAKTPKAPIPTLSNETDALGRDRGPNNIGALRSKSSALGALAALGNGEAHRSDGELMDDAYFAALVAVRPLDEGDE